MVSPVEFRGVGRFESLHEWIYPRIGCLGTHTFHLSFGLERINIDKSEWPP
jgi:hypothetical protein